MKLVILLAVLKNSCKIQYGNELQEIFIKSLYPALLYYKILT